MAHIMYDTNALLDLQEEAFRDDSSFYITDITLKELEDIKTSGRKDEETRYEARKVLHLLDENPQQYEVVLSKKDYFIRCEKFDLVDSPDTKIIYTTYCFFEDHGFSDGVFITSDLACKTIAKAIGLNVEAIRSNEDDEYKGYYEITLADQELADFYNNSLYQNINQFDLLINEYLIIKNPAGAAIDKYKWTEEGYKHVPYLTFESDMFGKVTPYKNDLFQQFAMDSLSSNQVTLIRGNAGTGKSFLSLAYLFALLERGKIDKIIIFCNTVAAKGAAKLGFYPGSRTEKLLDSQIGNLLQSKLGDKIMVERLIDDGELVLLPLSDIRGYDTTGMNAGIYITEAQNMDIELMRLALQRIGEDCICIIEGDDRAQVDMSMYAGANNGMKRVSQIFRGSDIYGEITLESIHRSKIAELAQLM